MKVGLFFGSFNPVHNGHLAIAGYLHKKEFFQQIWLVVTPNNPLKDKSDLICENHRLNMVKLAIRDLPFLRASDVEFSLPKPSYTIHTLHELEKLYPQNEFSLILGDDNMENFHRWKKYEEILAQYDIYVYPRNDRTLKKNLQHPHIVYFDAPLLPVSATEVRRLLQQKKPVGEYLPALVVNYIKEEKLYWVCNE